MADLLATTQKYSEPLSLGERKNILSTWADNLERASDVIAQCITSSTQKPISLSRTEVERGIGTIRGTVQAMDRLQPTVISLDNAGRAEIHQVPLGPVLAITPFNFPLNLAVHKLAPAIAAGCPVIWKPSPQAPTVAELVLEELRKTDVPEQLVQLAHLSNEQVAAMVQDERLAVLSFTGSQQVGHYLQKITTRAKVLLELGGNAAVILHEVDDIIAVAKKIAVGACANAGQVCISVQRIFVPEHHPEWITALIDAFNAITSGDPHNDATINGPVISDDAKKRIDDLLVRYRTQNGRILCGGTWSHRVLAPTLIGDLPAIAPGIYDTEVFAPLATVHIYGDIDGAIHLAELTPFGLQCGLFTNDENVIRKAFAKINVGTLIINDIPTRRDDRLPYGGMKDSGVGREGTLATVLDYTQPKVLWRPN